LTEILPGDQTRCEADFYTVDHEYLTCDLFAVANLLVKHGFKCKSPLSLNIISCHVFLCLPLSLDLQGIHFLYAYWNVFIQCCILCFPMSHCTLAMVQCIVIGPVCLCVGLGGCVCVCGSVTTITRNCVYSTKLGL